MLQGMGDLEVEEQDATLSPCDVTTSVVSKLLGIPMPFHCKELRIKAAVPTDGWRLGRASFVLLIILCVEGSVPPNSPVQARCSA